MSDGGPGAPASIRLIRTVLAVIALAALLAGIWVAVDAWQRSRVPRHGRPVESAAAPAAVPAAPQPQAATPAAPASNARLAIDWEDPDGRTYRSEIHLEPDAASPVAAEVLTRDYLTRQELVRYRATARRGSDGSLQIDGRGASVSGALAGEWSPDSFRIARDGRVSTADENGNPGTGWVAQEDGFTPAK